MEFLFERWKIFRTFVSPNDHVMNKFISWSIYYVNSHEIPNLRKAQLSCSHSNSNLFTCEDIMFPHESSSGIWYSLVIIIKFFNQVLTSTTVCLYSGFEISLSNSSTFSWKFLSRCVISDKVGSCQQKVRKTCESPLVSRHLHVRDYNKLVRRYDGRFPFNKNSGLNFGNSTFPMERYIPVAQTRPKPPRVWLLLV